MTLLADQPIVRLNPNARIRLLQMGLSRTPLLVIDDALENLEPLLAYARAQDFQAADAYYPGVRAPLPASYYQAVAPALAPLLAQMYGPTQDSRLQVQQAVLSLISTPASQLQPLQRLPHFDSSAPSKWALVHYLAEGEHGGTVFYRHNPTGIERLTPEHEARYFESCDAYLKQHGVPEGYPQARDPRQAAPSQFQLLQKVGYQQNRLLAYPGAVLHAAEVLPQDVSSCPSKGRLTANLFLEWQGG